MAEITLIADPARRKVGCVLLQAMAGCDYSLLYDLGFETQTWDTSPRPTQRRVSGTREEWEKFAKMCNEEERRA